MPVVVVVDDDPDLRMLMAMRLKACGMEVHQSGDGVAGLELIQGCRPDLVVLDWMMPGKTGIEVVREMRSDEVLSAIPVLMVTARTTPIDHEVGLAAGATELLTKPFELRSFLDRVRELLAERPESATA